MQIDNAYIDQISRTILGLFGQVGQTTEELHRKVHDVVREGMDHFELVNREEFDVATRTLANTRIKVEALEKKVAELEAALEARDAGKSHPE